MKATMFLTFFLLSNDLFAGAYIDFDLGMHLTNWKTETQNPYIPQSRGHNGRYLGGENPIFVFRTGYEYKIFRAYWEHMSSANNKRDTGVDVFMIGMHIKLKDVF